MNQIFLAAIRKSVAGELYLIHQETNLYGVPTTSEVLTQAFQGVKDLSSSRNISQVGEFSTHLRKDEGWGNDFPSC